MKKSFLALAVTVMLVGCGSSSSDKKDDLIVKPPVIKCKDEWVRIETTDDSFGEYAQVHRLFTFCDDGTSERVETPEHADLDIELPIELVNYKYIDSHPHSGYPIHVSFAQEMEYIETLENGYDSYRRSKWYHNGIHEDRMHFYGSFDQGATTLDTRMYVDYTDFSMWYFESTIQDTVTGQTVGEVIFCDYIENTNSTCDIEDSSYLIPDSLVDELRAMNFSKHDSDYITRIHQLILQHIY